MIGPMIASQKRVHVGPRAQPNILRFHSSRITTSEPTDIALPSLWMIMSDDWRLASNALPLPFLHLLNRCNIFLLDTSHTTTANSRRHWHLRVIFDCALLGIELFLRGRRREWVRTATSVKSSPAHQPPAPTSQIRLHFLTLNSCSKLLAPRLLTAYAIVQSAQSDARCSSVRWMCFSQRVKGTEWMCTEAFGH
jgi:hypothetical protein